MKKFFATVAMVLMVGVMATSAIAHSGRTDRNGGHYDRETGRYHYHR